MAEDNGLASTLAAIERARKAPREIVMPAIVKSAEELAAAQRALAETSRDTGALIDSITVTLPGQLTPPYSMQGGLRMANITEAIVTAGNADVRYAHLVEYGTSKMEAEPFFWPAYRLLRDRIKNRIRRAAKKAVKDGFNGQ
jgi:HK97 gp10 family phage protein